MDATITSFALGLLSTTSPCVLPLFPGFLAYLSGQQEARSGSHPHVLGVFVLAGVLSMMLVLGAIIASLAVPIGDALAIAIPLADALILGLGIALLLDRNPFRKLPQIRIPIVRHPLANAYVYGLLYGPIALPCSGALVVGVFALSLTVDEAFAKLWVFAWFGLGFGVPLLLISLLSGTFQRRLTRLFAVHSRAINRLGGALLVAVALYDLRANWTLLVAYYS
jgi:cytochrome c-type biogenesis protein